LPTQQTTNHKQTRYLTLINSRIKIKFVSQNYKLKAMLTKSKLIEQIESFPEEFSIDELVERLILAEEIGLNSICQKSPRFNKWISDLENI
jgi:hypothetical protein